MASNQDRLYHDKEWLREKYVDEGLTQEQIGEMCDVSGHTIGDWCGRFALPKTWRNEYPYYRWYEHQKYPVWRHSHDGATWQVQVHRLIAVAEYGFAAVANDDVHVHHKNHVPWDNRPENLELRSESDHMSYHQEERFGDKKYRDEKWLREKYVEEDLDAYEMAEGEDFTASSVLRWLKKYDIPVNGRGGHDPDAPHRERDWLVEKYVEEGLSSTEIAEMCDASPSTVCEWLRRHDVYSISKL